MNIRETINNSPNDWMVDIRSRDNCAVSSFPVRDLQELLGEVNTLPPYKAGVNYRHNDNEPPKRLRHQSYGGTD